MPAATPPDLEKGLRTPEIATKCGKQVDLIAAGLAVIPDDRSELSATQQSAIESFNRAILPLLSTTNALNELQNTEPDILPQQDEVAVPTDAKLKLPSFIALTVGSPLLRKNLSPIMQLFRLTGQQMHSACDLKIPSSMITNTARKFTTQEDFIANGTVVLEEALKQEAENSLGANITNDKQSLEQVDKKAASLSSAWGNTAQKVEKLVTELETTQPQTLRNFSYLVKELPHEMKRLGIAEAINGFRGQSGDVEACVKSYDTLMKALEQQPQIDNIATAEALQNFTNSIGDLQLHRTSHLFRLYDEVLMPVKADRMYTRVRRNSEILTEINSEMSEITANTNIDARNLFDIFVRIKTGSGAVQNEMNNANAKAQSEGTSPLKDLYEYTERVKAFAQEMTFASESLSAINHELTTVIGETSTTKTIAANAAVLKDWQEYTHSIILKQLPSEHGLWEMQRNHAIASITTILEHDQAVIEQATQQLLQEFPTPINA